MTREIIYRPTYWKSFVWSISRRNPWPMSGRPHSRKDWRRRFSRRIVWRSSLSCEPRGRRASQRTTNSISLPRSLPSFLPNRTRSRKSKDQSHSLYRLRRHLLGLPYLWPTSLFRFLAGTNSRFGLWPSHYNPIILLPDCSRPQNYLHFALLVTPKIALSSW